MSTVKRLLKLNRSHPAVKLVNHQLDDLLSSAARLDHGRPLPKSRDTEGRLRRELGQLHGAGVTGRRVLIVATALHMFARDNPGRVGRQWLGSRLHKFALARHVHALQFNRIAKGATAQLSALVRERVGEVLINATDQLLSAMEPAFARQSAPH